MKMQKRKGGALHMKEITYSQVGDYQFPNLKIESEQKPLGKYAMMRMNYLKNNHPGHLFALRANNMLNSHLMEIQIQAQQQIELMMEQMLLKHPAPDKEKNQMEWVKHMNILKAQVEEAVLQEIVYS
ncbi:MAG: TnpV protein [Faecalibacillus sp.]